jgi:hypothetical protein
VSSSPRARSATRRSPAGAEPPGAFGALVGDAAGHPLLAAHAARRRPALRLFEAVEARGLLHSELYGDLLHRSGIEYGIAIGIRAGRREAVVAGLGRTEREFSERDRDVLDLVRPGLEDALRAAEARGRLIRALAADPPAGTAVVLLDGYGEIERSSLLAERWLAEQFGPAEHRAGCRRRLPGGWRCRRGRRSSACATAGASPSTYCPAIRTRCCSRRTSRRSARTRLTASA